VETVSTIQKSCSSLEVWLGDISVEVGPKRLAEGFSSFKNLRTLYLRCWTIGDGEIEDHVFKLARNCMKLGKVVVVISVYSVKEMTLLISRDGSAPRI
jgi:hypothetical protein